LKKKNQNKLKVKQILIKRITTNIDTKYKLNRHIWFFERVGMKYNAKIAKRSRKKKFWLKPNCCFHREDDDAVLSISSWKTKFGCQQVPYALLKMHKHLSLIGILYL
jgi:hypothetical protein